MTDRDKVRLMMGDTIVGSIVFTDTEIDFFIAETTSLTLAAAMGLEAWMARYATNPSSEKIGDYSYSIGAGVYKKIKVCFPCGRCYRMRDVLGN